MDKKLEIANRLSYVRRMHRVSQNKLAQHFNYAPQTISSWECGRTLPDLINLLELADYYHEPIAFLVDHDEPVLTYKGAEIVNLFNGMPKEMQETVKEIMRLSQEKKND